MHRRSLLMGAAALPLMRAAPGRAAAPPVVSLAQGALAGRREAGVDRWAGIPYAAPPVGPLRWQPPQPHAGWTGLRDAGDFGPACLQPVARAEPERGLKDRPQSEDCLTLNIWAPEGARDLPVMVWLHGGSFRFGSGALALYHGDALARQGVVVVTLNYRLGLFGTFAHPALAGGAVNFGLLDQLAALDWVQGNIAGFGGDPRRVTLFGESAGGVSAGYLATSAQARGRFGQVIMQSGGLAVPLAAPEAGQAIGLRLGRAMGAETAEALRALPAEALRDAPYSAADVMPQRDGSLVTQGLAEGFASGAAGELPLLIGWNSFEAGFFGPRYWQGLAEELGPARFAEFQALCTWGQVSADAAAAQIASEWFAGAVSRAIALGHRGPVHAYRFGVAPAGAAGAIHTAEIPYVFGHAGADPAEQALARRMSGRWAAFATTGTPGAGWPRLDAGGGPFLRIGNDGETLGPDPTAALDAAIAAAGLPPRP